MSDNQGGPLHILYNIRDCECLPAAGHTQQCLVLFALEDTLGKLLYRFGLVACGLKRRV
jgi:hypothetical protein